MSNANESAFPEIASLSDRLIGYQSEEGTDVVSEVYSSGGLTKREYFAAVAMQGQLAFSPRDSAFEKAHQPEDVAKVSVSMADALLAELAKGKE